jgi:hypothetical protein
MINKNHDEDEFLVFKTPLKIALSLFLSYRALNKQHAASVSHPIIEH